MQEESSLNNSPTTGGFGSTLAIEAASGGLYAVDGQPVWPVCNSQERAALQRMTATLGNSTCQDRSWRASHSPDRLRSPDLR
jgi:hypothetical protein